MKELYELKGEGRSIRGIARELGVSRNSVRKYLRSLGLPREKPRRRRASKLDPYTEYIDVTLSEGLENCVVLLRELRTLGYGGGYTILKDYVQPRRRRRQSRATVRFETGPGEQAQIDWGSLAYIGQDGRKRGVWAFVMVLSWSRAILCGVRPPRRCSDLHAVARQCVRVLRRGAPPVPVRQHEGGGVGTRRCRSSRVEQPDAGLCAADRLRDEIVPAVPRADEG